jgi:hypothetical protein
MGYVFIKYYAILKKTKQDEQKFPIFASKKTAKKALFMYLLLFVCYQLLLTMLFSFDFQFVTKTWG